MHTLQIDWGGYLRGCDENYGCGYFGASRPSNSSGLHNGADYLFPTSVRLIYSPINGKVTKTNGQIYTNNPQYKYIEIKNERYEARLFYIQNLLVKNGDEVSAGQVLGTYHSLQETYPGIPDHVHLQLKRGGTLVDPEEILNNNTLYCPNEYLWEPIYYE